MEIQPHRPRLYAETTLMGLPTTMDTLFQHMRNDLMWTSPSAGLIAPCVADSVFCSMTENAGEHYDGMTSLPHGGTFFPWL
jgi:hypothetical protein